MNIVHLQLFGYIGGIQTLCREINLESKNNNYFYFLFEGGPISDQIAQAGGSVIIENAPHHFFIKSLRRFIAFCKEKKIDVILCHAGSYIAWVHTILASYKLKNVKIGIYQHSDVVDMIGTKGRRFRILKRVLKLAIKRADFVVAVSEYVKKSTCKILGISDEKVHVVYNGIRTELFERKKIEHNDKFRICYVGRIFPQKGVHLLIEAISRLSDEINCEVNLIGEGEDVPKLKEMVKELSLEDTVIFRGPQTDVASWLKKMDLFVHPAIWEEGFGITLIEAMAASVPCIAFKKGAIPELIDDGRNGYIIDNVSSDLLAEKIKDCYYLYKDKEEKYESLRKQAKITAEKFHIRKVIQQLENLYHV